MPPRPRLHDHYFVLRVTLDGIKPAIYRDIVVPATIPLDLLHDVLQVAMGWEDYHLHQYTIDGVRYTEDPEEPDEGTDENGVVLGELVHSKGQQFAYLYDFGDGWQHTVTVREVNRIPEGSAVAIRCVGGRRACPPEDVGGTMGFAEYLKALANPKHAEHASMLDWRGPFDPTAFDADAINSELDKLVRWSRPRKRHL